MTSARPIISAAAVEAVRCGSRCVFSRASFPDAPPTVEPGQPSDLRERAHDLRRDQRDADEEHEDAGAEREQPLRSSRCDATKSP